jgi:hypothetical protein
MNIPEKVVHYEGKKDAVATLPFIMGRKADFADDEHANKKFIAGSRRIRTPEFRLQRSCYQKRSSQSKRCFHIAILFP